MGPIAARVGFQISFFSSKPAGGSLLYFLFHPDCDHISIPRFQYDGNLKAPDDQINDAKHCNCQFIDKSPEVLKL